MQGGKQVLCSVLYHCAEPLRSLFSVLSSGGVRGLVEEGSRGSFCLLVTAQATGELAEEKEAAAATGHVICGAECEESPYSGAQWQQSLSPSFPPGSKTAERAFIVSIAFAVRQTRGPATISPSIPTSSK